MKTDRRAVPLVIAAFLATAAVAAIAPGVALGATTVQVVADVGGCFVGHQPTSGNLTVTWTDKNGHVKSNFSATGSLSSDWRPPQAACQNHVVEFGDLIHVHVTSPDDVTHDFRIRKISSTFHRSTNRVEGTTPVGGALSLFVGRPSLTTGSIPKMCSFMPTRDSASHFIVDATNCAPGYDTIGGDAAVVVWNTPGGDFERLFVRAPYIEAFLRKASLHGYLDAGTSATLTLRSSGGQVRGTSKVTASALTGLFKGPFRNNGVPVNAFAGNVIRGNWEGTRAYTVRQLALTIAANQISGACDPNVRYGLAIIRGGKVVANNDGVTDGTGATEHFDASEAGLDPGDIVMFTCASAGGDRTTLTRAIS